MKVIDRVGKQANMRKKAEEYNLKFKHSNWNSKSNSNIYYVFEVKFGVFLEVIFRHAIYFFKAREVKNPTLSMVCKSKLKRKVMDDWKELQKDKSNEC